MSSRRNSLLIVLVTFGLSASFFSAAEAVDPSQEKWLDLARKDLKARSEATKAMKASRAKNLILFIGDGMGVSTVSAARALKAHLDGKLVGEESLSFEEFPFSAFSKTYNADMTVADSASTATAYWCGVKTKQNLVGVDERVQYQDCASSREESNLKCIGHYAKDSGKSVGIVTTVSVTHASPSPGYAHSASRKWETDGKMEDEDRKAGCKDIAQQFVEIGGHVDVLMGAGTDYFENRTDKRNLTEEWLEQRKPRKAAAVKTKQELNRAVENGITDVLGLFAPSEMLYSVDYGTSSTEPTLNEMVISAISILKRNPKGFFLFVEGGKIDWGHHNNRAALALHDTIAMAEAVKTAKQLAGDDTLIVVTADHSHVFSFGGYPPRDASVLDKNDRYALDNKPFTYLSYGNGPGFGKGPGTYNDRSGRRNVTNVNTTVPRYQQESAVPLDKDTHGGEDVPVYAIGPMSHLFTGTIEQHSIPHFMMYAACIGPKHVGDCSSTNAAAVGHIGYQLVTGAILLAGLLW